MKHMYPFMKRLALVLMFGWIVQISISQTYYSQGSGNFSDLAIWNTLPGGGGASPTSVQAATGVFFIQTGHNIVVDDSINIAGLNVSGTLTFGNSSTNRVMWVQSSGIVVNNNGTIQVGSYNATHRLVLNAANFQNNGTVILRPGAINRVVNVTTRGTSQFSGTNSPTLSNLLIQTGTTTANVALIIKGDFSVQSGATFTSNNFTHKITGNFNNSGTFNYNSSTWEFNTPLVQTISGANLGFYNLTVNGGGVVSLGSYFNVYNNFLVTSNSKVDVQTTIQFNGNWTLHSGSEYNATAGETRFWRNGSAQNVLINGTAQFFDLSARYPGAKQITGNIVVNNYFFVYSDATIQDAVVGQTHTLRGDVRLEGVANFTHKIVLNSSGGRSIFHSNPNNTITFGPADIEIDGYYWIGNSDVNNTTLHCQGNLNLISGYLVIRQGSSLTGSASKSFYQSTNTNLYIRGTDNYPIGFGSYTHEVGSVVRYDRNINQVVRGGVTYPHLVLNNHDAFTTGSDVTKTLVGGDIQINGTLYIQPGNNSTVRFDIGNNSVGLTGNLEDYWDPTQTRTVVITQSGGTFTLNGIDNNQYFYRRDPSSQYTFNNFSIINRAPTDVRLKFFVGDDVTNPGNSTIDFTVLGNFTATNESTNPTLVVNVDLNNIRINGNNSGTFTLGDNVRVLVGSNQFGASVNSFSNSNLHTNSTVRYDANTLINIPSIAYGNLEFGGTGGIFQVVNFGLIVKGNISRVGGTPTFRLRAGNPSANPNHQIQGNWNLTSSFIDATVIGSGRPTVTFNGNGPQNISEATFWHVSYEGSGEKIILGNQTIQGNVNIGNGVTVNASNFNYTVGGNWTNLSDGQFLPTFGTVTFNGTSNQTISIQNGNGSFFNNITIDKPFGTTLIANSNITATGSLTFIENRGNLDLLNNTLTIGGNLIIRLGNTLSWTNGAKIHFNSNSAGQIIRNFNPSTLYPTLEFSGSGVKRFYDNPLFIEGDLIINGATLMGEWWDHYLKGNFVNNSGTFQHYRILYLNGNDQYIGSGEFQDLYATGNGTKYLTANWNLRGSLTIDTTAVVDVSPDGGITTYSITLNGNWVNNLFNPDRTKTGKFIPRTGTVYIIGNWSRIYTGDSIDVNHVGRVGKQFYNLEVALGSNSVAAQLYPIFQPGFPNIKSEANDLRVLNNFKLEQGVFYLYWNKMYVGGNFDNLGGNFQMNVYYSGYPQLYLEGNAGPYRFDPGENYLLRYIEFRGNGEYRLQRETIVENHNALPNVLISAGTLNLNHNILQLNNQTWGDLTISSTGSLIIDSLAELRIPNNRTLTNNGIFRIVGTPSGIASLRCSQPGSFNFIQNSGTFHAKYYSIENTSGWGLRFLGGSIDTQNNMSEGRFAGGASGSNTAYISLESGFTLNTDLLVPNVNFYTGPQKNVRRVNGTGTGKITFHNAGGPLAGSAYEIDDPNLVDWTFDPVKLWTGLAGDGQWNSPNNWTGNSVPASTDIVRLDNTHVAGPYSVAIQGNATCKSLSISGSSTTLAINGGKLSVVLDLTISTGNTLVQTNSADSVILGGSFTNSGTYNPGTSIIKFAPVTGSHVIVTNANPFYRIDINGTGGEIVLGTNITVANHIKILSGSFNASNRTIFVQGNWTANNAAFNYSISTVHFNRNDATDQEIEGGIFYNLTFSGSSVKKALSTLFIQRDVVINAGSRFDGGEQTIYVRRLWYNYEGNNGFNQYGGGKVVFDGTGTIYVGNYGNPASTRETTFNHLSFEGNSTKYIANNITVKGNLFNLTGSNIYVGAIGFASTEINGTAGGTFIMDGGWMYLLGVESFPKGFGSYNLSGGQVEYRGPIDQIVTGGVQYFNLYLRNTTNGAANPKVNKTASAPLYVKNNIHFYTQNGGWDGPVQLNMNGYDLYLEGTISADAPKDSVFYQINWGGGTLFHDGANFSPTPWITHFNNFIKRGTGAVIQNNHFVLTGNMEFRNGTSLNMRDYTINCVTSNKTFKMGENSYIYNYTVDTTATVQYAFPTGFSSYNIASTNGYYLRGTHKQSILPGVEYGNVYLWDNFARQVYLHGDLRVEGDLLVGYDLIELRDNGHSIYVRGANLDLRNYVASPTSTLYLTGTGYQRIYAGGNFNDVRLNAVQTSGNGHRVRLDDLNFYFTGNVQIQPSDTIETWANVFFSGNTFTNLGRFDHNARIFRFQGGNQTINPGSNRFNEVIFENGGTKNTVNNGFNIRQNITITATPASTVDFGTLTHNIGSEYINILGASVWSVSNANLIFDRVGTQFIPKIFAQDVSFTSGGTKYLYDSISVRDLYVGPGTVLRPTLDPTYPNNFSVRGNWTVEGNYIPDGNTVYFESDDNTIKTITTGGRTFENVVFNSVLTSNRLYTLLDNVIINGNLILNSGAHLKLNGKTLYIGNDDVGLPPGEVLRVNSGATLEVDAASELRFSLADLDPTFDIYGTLIVVGTYYQPAIVREYQDYGWNRGIKMTAYSGASLRFNNYQVERVNYDGFVINNGVTINSTDNFSNGVWLRMYPWNQFTDLSDGVTIRDRFYYLQILTNTSGLPNIQNVFFGHPTTPVVGRHFNVNRPVGYTGDITFDGDISGNMGSSTYENDPANQVHWPAPSKVVWTGVSSADWFDPGNWNPPIVPTALIDAEIPRITSGGSNPYIFSSGAICRDLILTNGLLTIEAGVDTVKVSRNITMGASSILAYGLDAVLLVAGQYDINATANIIENKSTVFFQRNGGTVQINPRNSKFYNIKFNGVATYNILGNLTVNGKWTQIGGTVNPSTVNYIYYLYGDYEFLGGSFLTNNIGWFYFHGSDQIIRNGRFSRLAIRMGGTKTFRDSTVVYFNDPNSVNKAFIIGANTTLSLANHSTILIRGNFASSTNSVVTDNEQSIYFSGRWWDGVHTHVGNGWVNFMGSDQYFNGNFANLSFTEPAVSTKYTNGNTSLTGSLTINSYNFRIQGSDQIVCSSGNGQFSVGQFNNGNSRVYYTGVNSHPSGFNEYLYHPNSFAYYSASFNQTVRGKENDIDIIYGNLYIANNGTKTLSGDIIVKSNLYLETSATLNASVNTITLGGNWYNNNSSFPAIFTSNNGEVIFNGSNNQYIYLVDVAQNDFYKVRVDKPTNTFVYPLRNIEIVDKLWVRNGRFRAILTVTVGGDFVATDNGTFDQTGTYILNKPSGSATIMGNNSILNNLRITGGATYNILDNFRVYGEFVLNTGILNLNGNTLYLGDGSDVASINSVFNLGEGGTVSMGNLCNLNINNGGEISIIGSPTNISSIVSTNAGWRYYLEINSGGTIRAKNYLIKDLQIPGVFVKSGAIIDPQNNFSFGTFSNPIGGGVCLQIANDQSFTGSDSIVKISFPQNPLGGTRNIKKVNSVGVVDIYQWTGNLAGPAYEDDPYNLVNWFVEKTITWVGGYGTGSQRHDWKEPNNWDLGRLPEPDDNVVINNTGFSCYLRDLPDTVTIRSLTVNGPLYLVRDLSAVRRVLNVTGLVDIKSDVYWDGDSTILRVGEGLSVNSVFRINVPNGGTIVMSGFGEASIFNSLNNNKLRLVIEKQGTVNFMANTNKVGYLQINSGATLKLPINSLAELHVFRSFINYGTFVNTLALLKLGSVGNYQFLSGNSSFGKVTLLEGNYTLVSPVFTITDDLTIQSGASLNVGSNTIKFGHSTNAKNLLVAGSLFFADNSRGKFTDNSVIEVLAGGLLSLVGTVDNEVVFTNQGSGRYSVNVSGTIAALHYKMEYLAINGLLLTSSATINPTENLSFGAFIFGHPSGRYITFMNSWSDTIEIYNVNFSQGALYNATRTCSSCGGIVRFRDSYGLRAGHYFEEDDGLYNSGKILWVYTTPTLFWTGAEDTRWDNPHNWNPEAVPADNAIIFIQTGAPRYPIIDDTFTPTQAHVKRLTIYTGASLTISHNKNIKIAQNFDNGGVLEVVSGSLTTIDIGGTFSNNGTFINGGSSTIELTSPNNIELTFGTAIPYNLHINSGNGLGNSIFTTRSAITIQGDLIINAGTFAITNSSHTITVGGNFVNNSGFQHGNSTFVFNGNSNQTINNPAGSNFFNIQLTGNGNKTLLSNITILRDLTIGAVLNAGNNTIQIGGDWKGTKTFNRGTSTVVFNSNASQIIDKNETFFNLVINNTYGLTAVALQKNVSVDNQLTLTRGKVEAGINSTIALLSSASLVGGSANSYIVGYLSKQGSSDFVFHVGTDNVYAPVAISGLTGSATFRAAYFESGYNPTYLQVGLNKASNVEHWNLSRLSGTAEAFVTFYWYNGTRSGITNLQPLVAAYYETGNGWKSMGQSSTTGNTTAGTITSGVRYNDFGVCGFGWAYEDNNWTGLVNSNWNEPGNWSLNQIPTATSNVIINGGAPNYPVLSTNAECFKLTISSNGQLTVNSSVWLTIAEDFTMNANSQLINNGEIRVAGNYLNNSTNISSGIGSIMVFNGTVTQNISNIYAHNVIMSGIGAKNLSGDHIIDGNLSIGSTVNAQASNIYLSGNFSLTSGSFNRGTSTLHLVGNIIQYFTGNQANLYNLTVNNNSVLNPQVILNSNVVVYGTLTLNNGIVQTTPSSVLSIEVGGNVSGGNVNSYISGPMRKYGITDFVFPIGKNGRFARLGISNMSGSAAFVAEYFDNPYTNVTSVTSPLHHVSKIEYWDLSRVGSVGTAQPYVTLYWEDTARSKIDNLTTLRVAHFRSSSWREEGIPTAYWANQPGAPGYIQTGNPIDEFSPFTFASIHPVQNPLPVQLVRFEANVTEKRTVLVEWATASEQNSDRFEVEKSKDGYTFERFAVVRSAGNSNLLNLYATEDKYPFEGISYYRLVQYDIDGKRTIFPMVSVQLSHEVGITVQVNPNPINNLANLVFNKEVSNAKLTLIGIAGNMVDYREFPGSIGRNIDISDVVSNIRPGIYYLKIEVHGELIVTKIIKN